MVDGRIECVAVLTAVAVADGRAETCPDQSAGQVGAGVSVTRDAAKHGADQRAGQHRIAIGLAEAVGVNEAVARVAVMVPGVIAPAVTRAVIIPAHMVARAMVVPPVEPLIAAVVALIIALVTPVEAVIPAIVPGLMATVAAIKPMIPALIAPVEPLVAAIMTNVLAPFAVIKALITALVAAIETLVSALSTGLMAALAAVKALVSPAVTPVDTLVCAAVSTVRMLLATFHARLLAPALLNSLAAGPLDPVCAVAPAFRPVGISLLAFARALLAVERCDRRLGGRGGDQAGTGEQSDDQNGAGEGSDHHRAGPFSTSGRVARIQIELTKPA